MSKFERYFNKDTAVKDVDWEDWDAVVSAFRRRIVGWYLEPLAEFPKTGHEAFPVLLTTAMLLRLFAQLRFRACGADAQAGLLRTVHEDFRTPVPGLGDAADVFAASVCAPMLEGGRLSKVAGISGTGKVVKLVGPVVVFDPWVVRDIVRDWFESYCDVLAANPRTDTSARLRVYLRVQCGVAIPEPNPAGGDA